MLLQKCMRDLKPLTPSTTTSCQHTEVFAFLITRLMEDERGREEQANEPSAQIRTTGKRKMPCLGKS